MGRVDTSLAATTPCRSKARHFVPFLKPQALLLVATGLRNLSCSMWSTSVEAAYPALLSRRVAQCLVEHVQTLGVRLSDAPSRPLQLATQRAQSSKFPPLIPEFYKFSWEPAGFQSNKSRRILFSHASGVKDGGDKNGAPNLKRPRKGHSLDDSVTNKTPLSECPSPCPLVSPLDSSGGVPNPSGCPSPNPCETLPALSASEDEPKTVKVGHWLAPDQHVAKAKEERR